MSSTTAFLVLILVFFVGHGSCNEESDGPSLSPNGTTILWNDIFATESSEGSDLKTEYDAKGLQPWYDFANSFISTVLNKEPYSKLRVSCYFAFISCSEIGNEALCTGFVRVRLINLKQTCMLEIHLSLTWVPSCRFSTRGDIMV